LDSRITLPPCWVGANEFEEALQRADIDPHDSRVFSVVVEFPTQCKVMVDAAIRLLSLVNQLDHCTRRVRLSFEEGEAGTMGYLNRMGFFDNLSRGVEVIPEWPTVSGKRRFGGRNASLVEIERVRKDSRDETLPTRLTDSLMRACGDRHDASELEGAAWTIFAELIDNVFSHSDTPLDGYAAMQVYPGGGHARVAVSDSGLGIMQTLRPALKSESPKLAGLTDAELLVEVFRQGVSRHGPDRGCGLKGSAAKAIKFRANLDVRMPTNRVQLIPAHGTYRVNTAYLQDELPLLWGTHLCFKILLKA
jgi:hypothetical protein